VRAAERETKREAIRREERKHERRENRNARFVSREAVGMLLMALRKVQVADHDYDGHRVRSMEHMSKALHQLGEGVNFNPNVGLDSGTLNQEQSDEVLRQAIHHLRFVEGSIGHGTEIPEHVRGARISVGEAIRELHLALNVR
jgi:hypothetical protein